MSRDALEGKPEKKSIDEFLSDPAVQRGTQELARADQASHRPQGDAYFQEGKFREAIEEYRKDTELEITTYAQASVVQRGFCHMGDAFLFLGELEEAVAAYKQALEMWQAYGYGQMPLASLAVAYLEQGELEEAMRVCEAHPEEAQDPCVQQVLAKCRRLQAGGEPSPEPVRGCRRIHLPIRVTGRPGDGGVPTRR
jgi:tetratricopeptide (TPR) repeat protein